jgi:hypothetical protein
MAYPIYNFPMTRASRAMKVTTVRFGVDLWGLLDREAAHAGVSVSQYIREAALARAAAAAAGRGEEPLELLGELQRPRTSEETLAAALDVAAGHRSGARALRAQSKQAARQAHAVTARSERVIAQANVGKGEPPERK